MFCFGVFLMAFVFLTGCSGDKKAEAPKEFSPLPKNGPVDNKVGGEQKKNEAPPPPKAQL